MNDKVINELYARLEKIIEFGSFSPSLIFEDIDSYETLTATQQMIFSIEMNVQLKIIDKQHIEKVFGAKRQETIEYINNRLKQTQNNYLLARYNHFLWIFTQNNNYCQHAINHYILHLNDFDFSEQEKQKAFDFSDILENVISMALKIKFQLDVIKEKVLLYLRSGNVSVVLRIEIIQLLSECQLFKIKELEFVPKLCIELANSVPEHHWVEKLLNLGLHFASKFPNLKELKCKIYELLGDNEQKLLKRYDGKFENIIIPHQNQNIYSKMMGYYKLAKNTEKFSKYNKLYNENKKNLKYLSITNKVKLSDDTINSLNGHLNYISNGTSEEIMFNLCLGVNVIFIPNEFIEKQANEDIEKYFHLKYFSMHQSDINHNSREMDTFVHQKYEIYNFMMRNNFNFILIVFENAVFAKKLSYSKLKTFLEKSTFFGVKLTQNQSEEDQVDYTWFNQIDFALKSFFQQFARHLTKKETDWRIVIDILSIKFEGILRDMVNLSGGDTTGIDKIGNTYEVLLDELLRSEVISKIFNEDDRNLFLFTFTKVGLNIRNNVAHSFYKKQDYTIYKAVLVLLCILRLVKFIPER